MNYSPTHVPICSDNTRTLEVVCTLYEAITKGYLKFNDITSGVIRVTWSKQHWHVCCICGSDLSKLLVLLRTINQQAWDHNKYFAICKDCYPLPLPEDPYDFQHPSPVRVSQLLGYESCGKGRVITMGGVEPEL